MIVLNSDDSLNYDLNQYQVCVSNINRYGQPVIFHQKFEKKKKLKIFDCDRFYNQLFFKYYFKTLRHNVGHSD